MLALSACQMGGGLSRALRENAPPPATGFGQGVDGLEVGHRLMAAGEHEMALRAYYRAAAENGMSVDVLSAIGSANLALGRLGQAEQVLRRAVDLDPTFVPAQNNLGVTLVERGKLAEARVVFQQAFQLDSGQTDSLRENLRRVMEMTDPDRYADPDAPAETFQLVRRGENEVVLLSEL